jgi:formylglycine-generating enzyme required for sulfatase activity/tRNA A-37 threonylcarbamoyl transferase component Bud32
VPEIVGQYELKEVLGGGGMATVYRGEHVSGIGMVAAVKKLHPHLALDASIRKRLRLEAQALARLKHPNIVAILDFVEAGDMCALVTELVEGRTLRAVMGDYVERPMPLSLALMLFRQVLNGCGHAHKHQILHRDIKPGNVMVTPDNQVKVLDFGIANLLDTERITRTGVAVGTPVYMAPEQIDGLEPLDERADVYALGVTLWEMLAGQGARPIGQQGWRLNPKEINRLRERGVPQGLVDVIEAMIRENRDDRLRSCDEALQALNWAMDDSTADEERPSLRSHVSQPARSVLGPETGHGAGQPQAARGGTAEREPSTEPTLALPGGAPQITAALLQAHARASGGAASSGAGAPSGPGRLPRSDPGHPLGDLASAPTMPMQRPAAELLARGALLGPGGRPPPGASVDSGGGSRSGQPGLGASASRPRPAPGADTVRLDPTLSRQVRGAAAGTTGAAAVRRRRVLPAVVALTATVAIGALLLTLLRGPRLADVRGGEDVVAALRAIPGVAVFHQGAFFYGPEDRKVVLSAFAVDLREVTLGDWRRCTEADAAACPDLAARYVAPGGGAAYSDAKPVQLISWREAQGFCAWRGASLQLPAGYVGRLPTDAEWERVARGTARPGRPFPCGQTLDTKLASVAAALVPDAGSTAGDASPDGVLDLCGSVEEWIWDAAPPGSVNDQRSDAYLSEKQTDPARGGDASAEMRATRGASHMDGGVVTERYRSQGRTWVAASRNALGRGFRCVLGVEPAP